eukprot:10977321-Lingulodinium_polyedra.AAC.1
MFEVAPNLSAAVRSSAARVGAFAVYADDLCLCCVPSSSIHVTVLKRRGMMQCRHGSARRSAPQNLADA